MVHVGGCFTHDARSQEHKETFNVAIRGTAVAWREFCLRNKQNIKSSRISRFYLEMNIHLRVHNNPLSNSCSSLINPIPTATARLFKPNYNRALLLQLDPPSGIFP